MLILHDVGLLHFDNDSSKFLIQLDKDILQSHLEKVKVKKFHVINEDALIWSPIININYGVSPDRRKRRTTLSGTGE